MLIKKIDILDKSMMQCDNNVLNVYNITNLMFKSRYLKLIFPTIEFATNHWKNIYFRAGVCVLKTI